MQVKGSTLYVKPRVGVTKASKQGYQWSNKKDFCTTNLRKLSKAVRILANCLSNGQKPDYRFDLISWTIDNIVTKTTNGAMQRC